MDRISTSSRFSHTYRIKRQYLISFRSGFGFDVKWSRRRRLSGSQSIVLIVCNDIRQINVSSARMEKMSKSDSISITISSVGDNGQIRIRHFDSGGKRQRSSVQNFTAISVDILAHFTRTSDTRKNDNFVFWYIQLFDSCLNCRHDKEISASWTPLNFS